MAASQTSQKQNIHLKVVLIGSSGVGKTCLINRYIDDTFNADALYTVGAAFFGKQWGPYKIAIWDTAGQERFTGIEMLSHYFRGAGAAIMIYDPASRDSFLELRTRFLPLLPTDINCLKVVVAAKMDLVTSSSSREVTQQEARDFCREINKELPAALTGLPYFETSSQTGESVKETFEHIFEICLSKSSEQYRISPKDTITLHSETPGDKESIFSRLRMRFSRMKC